MKRRYMITAVCLIAALGLASCSPKDNAVSSSQSSSSSSSQTDNSSKTDTSKPETSNPIDKAAYQVVLQGIAGYEPDTAGGSIKIYIVAADLLNFTETYQDSQSQALIDETNTFLKSLDADTLSLFKNNMDALDKTAQSIITQDSAETKDMLEEAGNPQKYDSYSADKYQSVKKILDDCLSKTK